MNMQEIKCPKCGEVFQVDASGYASIVKQVRDKEFHAELQTREQQFKKDQQNAVALAEAKQQSTFREQLSAKDTEIEQLKHRLALLEQSRDQAIGWLLTAPFEDVFEVTETKAPFPPYVPAPGEVACDICGEKTLENRLHSKDGRLVCSDCL
jgi:formylmethanofuran dehydrogenase subunit E